ncbi:MAG: RNA polymerase sigma factor [Solirubrobacteraceae bacterium]
MRDEDFERLYAEHAEPLFRFLVYRTGDRSLSEDLMAEAFERALRARRTFDPRKASSKTWLYTIALNCLRDHARRRDAEHRALERASGAPEAAHHDPTVALDEREQLMTALRELAPEEREAVALRFGADLTVPEISKLLRVKLSTAEGRVYRALRKLREDLEEDRPHARKDAL